MSINRCYEFNNNAVFNNYINTATKSDEQLRRRHKDSFLRPLSNHNRLMAQRRLEREAQQKSAQEYIRNVKKGQQELDFYGKELQELKDKICSKYYGSYKPDY